MKRWREVRKECALIGGFTREFTQALSRGQHFRKGRPGVVSG